MWRWLTIGALAVGGLAGPLTGASAAPPTSSVPDDSNPDDSNPDDSNPDDSNPDDSTPDDSTPDDDVLDDVGTVIGGSGGDGPPVTLPVVPIPVGCEAPTLPHIVFTGRVVERDFRTVRFEIEQTRAGRSAPFASADGRIDVRYGLDSQYLTDGERYLVAATVDPDLGLLVSHVTEPIEHFGGDEIIGVSETDITCPAFEDPARTLHTDGTPVAASIIEPFVSARARVVAAILIPFGVAAAMIFALAALRLSIASLFRSAVGATRH